MRYAYVSTYRCTIGWGRRTRLRWQLLPFRFAFSSQHCAALDRSGWACTARMWPIEASQVRVVAHSLGCMHVLAATSQLSPDERPDLIYLCAPAVCEGECRDILACVRQITCVQLLECDCARHSVFAYEVCLRKETSPCDGIALTSLHTQSFVSNKRTRHCSCDSSFALSSCHFGHSDGCTARHGTARHGTLQCKAGAAADGHLLLSKRLCSCEAVPGALFISRRAGALSLLSFAAPSGQSNRVPCCAKYSCTFWSCLAMPWQPIGAVGLTHVYNKVGTKDVSSCFSFWVRGEHHSTP